MANTRRPLAILMNIINEVGTRTNKLNAAVIEKYEAEERVDIISEGDVVTLDG